MFRFLTIILLLATAAGETVEWSERIYLATYPRSGNHWMRYLIEDATHIATGSVYPDGDPPHLADPYPWAAYSTDRGYRGDARYPRPNEPFVVKTHFPALQRAPFDRKPYKAVIRIVRHPVDSFYSWYIYRRQGDTKENTIPRDVLELMVKKWKRFQNYWDVQPRVLTIRYEDMLEDVEGNLRQVLNEIGYKYTRSDLNYAVEMNQPRGGVLKHLEHFTAPDLAYIRQELSAEMQRYNYTLNE